MRGSLGIGLVIGLAVGAAAMYLALRPPWGGHGTAPADAGVVAMAPTDAGAGSGKKKKHFHRNAGGGGGGGGATTGDESGWGGGGGGEEVELPPQLIALTAADRALEWRGDDTSRPAQKLDMANGVESRSLDDGEISSVISGQSGGVQSCVVSGAANTDLRGTITVKMIVDGGGHVAKSKVQAFHYMFEHGLLGCIQRALGHVKFPGVGGSTLVTLPVNFT